MFYLILSIHVLLCFVLIGLVLLQQGKGADLGAALGGGSHSLFGAGGATAFVVKATTVSAMLFMVTSILLIKYYGPAESVAGTSADRLEGSLMKEAVERAQQPVATTEGAAPEGTAVAVETVIPADKTPEAVNTAVEAAPAAVPAAAEAPKAENSAAKAN
jgi:preprotein translocase subunit SecG